MSLNTNAIATLGETKSYCGENSDVNDSTIELYINALSDIFETKSGRKLKKQTLTDYRIDGNGEREISLNWIPVQSIAKVEIRYAYDDSVYKTITDSSKWVLKDGASGLLMLKEDVFICGRRNILITMDVGFNSTDSKMSSIKLKFLLQTAFDYRKWQNREIGINSRNFADGSVGFVPSKALLPEVEDFLRDLADIRP